MDQQHNHPLLQLPSKPTTSCTGGETVLIGLSSGGYGEIQAHKGKLTHVSEIIHNQSITSISYKHPLILTSSHDGQIQLTDYRSHEVAHTLSTKRRQPYNVADVNQHIVVAAHGTNLTFWDLRNMKPRCTYRESFNAQITDMKFDRNICTHMMGCSTDGMVNMFDLTQPNEQQSLIWAYKGLQHAESLACSGQAAILRTAEHQLIRILEGTLLGRTYPNSPEQPKHITWTSLSDTKQYGYCAWNINNKVVEVWEGELMDGMEKCIGWAHGVHDVEVLQKFPHHIIYGDEDGRVHLTKITRQQRLIESSSQQTIQKPVEQKRKRIWQINKKEQQRQETNENGYMLSKPWQKKQHRGYRPF